MSLAELLFRIRGFTPLPFIAAALIWAELHPIGIVIGIIIAVAGEMLRVRSLRFIGGASRTRDVGAPSLVDTGPYAHVRNPLYFGNMMIYTGFAVGSGSLFPCLPIITFLYFGFQYGMIIRLEEKILVELFGEKYEEYCRKVPRLIPKPATTGSHGKPDLDLPEALVQEKSTLTSFTLVWVVLILRLFIIP